MVDTTDLKSVGEIRTGSIPVPRTISMINAIFVFGSNLAGRHGRGSASEAMIKHGAIYGRGLGHHGNSYAIPTKDANLKSLELFQIRYHITNFLQYARHHPELQFNIVDIGCGLAGYKPEQIAPLWQRVPRNCHFLGALAGKVNYE